MARKQTSRQNILRQNKKSTGDIFNAKIKKKGQLIDLILLGLQINLIQIKKITILAIKKRIKSKARLNSETLRVRFCGKVMLKMIVRKTIQGFSQSLNILERLLIAIVFQQENLKDFLSKLLSFTLHLIIVLLQC